MQLTPTEIIRLGLEQDLVQARPELSEPPVPSPGQGPSTGGWKKMEVYPDKGRRDESGKWVDEEGPQVQLLMEDGSVVTAKWYGAKTNGGGEAWAFWVDGSPRGIGLYEPMAWRALTYPVELRRREESKQ